MKWKNRTVTVTVNLKIQTELYHIVNNISIMIISSKSHSKDNSTNVITEWFQTIEIKQIIFCEDQQIITTKCEYISSFTPKNLKSLVNIICNKEFSITYL